MFRFLRILLALGLFGLLASLYLYTRQDEEWASLPPDASVSSALNKTAESIGERNEALAELQKAFQNCDTKKLGQLLVTDEELAPAFLSAVAAACRFADAITTQFGPAPRNDYQAEALLNILLDSRLTPSNPRLKKEHFERLRHGQISFRLGRDKTGRWGWDPSAEWRRPMSAEIMDLEIKTSLLEETTRQIAARKFESVTQAFDAWIISWLPEGRQKEHPVDLLSER